MNTTGSLELIGPQSIWWENVLKLDQLYFPRPWSREQWSSMNMNHHILGVWVDNNELQGFALFGFMAGDDTAHLLKILVTPDSRGTGVSSTFWSAFIDNLRSRKAEKVFLEVEESNLVAQAFYRKVGFKVLRTIKGCYSDGTNGIALLLTL